MKFCLPILLLLCSASTALAQSQFDVSCENVYKMRIVHLNPKHWNLDGHEGGFYILNIRLNVNGEAALKETRAVAPNRTFLRDGIRWMPQPYAKIPRVQKDIVITAHGVPLPNDDPLVTCYGGSDINIPIIRQQDAFDAARAICPALVPDKVLEDGEAE